MSTGYDEYDQWKGWGHDQFMVLSAEDRAYYRAEFADVPVRGEKVLEVGFGSGSLLAWLSGEGAQVYGTEISTQGMVLAGQRGITVLDAGLTEATAMKGQFGVVAAFDVLEHLTHDQIRDLLAKAAVLLRPGGHFIARFPNGGSPFGRLHQHSDMTHVTTLTELKLSQLMLGTPFAIRRTGDAAIPVLGGIPTRLAKHGRNLLRRVFERGVKALYGITTPFHLNLVVVLRRLDEEPGIATG